MVNLREPLVFGKIRSVSSNVSLIFTPKKLGYSAFVYLFFGGLRNDALSGVARGTAILRQLKRISFDNYL